LLIALSNEHTQGDALGCCGILYQEGDYDATPGDAILQAEKDPEESLATPGLFR